MSAESRAVLAALRRQMDRHFNLDEIELLCFDLGIDYEHVAGEAKPKKIHNLILLVTRNGRLPDLLELLGEERPGIDWPAIPPDFDPAPDIAASAEEASVTNQFQVGDVAKGATVAGNVGEGAVVAGASATVVAAGASLSVQNYQISGDIAGDVNIAGDVHIGYDELPIPAPPAPERPPAIEGFVGREQELGYFKETLRTAHLAVISGMAGMGKTTLAAVLAEQVAPSEAVFWHTFRQGEGVEAIIWKLAGFLAWHGRDDLWQLLQRTRLTRGNLPPTNTLLDYLLQMLRGRDLLLCLDDIHVVDDDPQIDLFVERVRAAVLAGELSIIMTSRRLPDFVTTVDTAFLSGLTLAATQQLLLNRDVELPQELIQQLHTCTQGNAQLLILSIDALYKSRNPARLIGTLAEAENVERFLLREIDEQVSRTEREVMSAVAILLGYPGSRYAIAATLDGQNVRRELRELTDRFLLTSSRSEELIEYGQHAILRTFYYDELDRRQRQVMHRLAGEYYRDEELNLMKAAVHFEQAGDLEMAAQVATKDVWASLNQGHSPVLRDLLQRFQPDQLEPAAWIQVKLAQGQVYAFLGDSAPARASYQEVLSQLAARPDSAEVRSLRARVYRGLGELLEQEAPQEALSWLQRGLEEIEGSAGDEREQAELYESIGTIQMWLGSYAEAAAALERGLSLLPDEPSQSRAAILEALSAVAFLQAGDVDQAIKLAAEALQISRQMHDHFRSANILSTLGSHRFDAGDWPGAIESFRQALQMAEQIGSDKSRAIGEMNLGNAQIYLGQFDEAEMHLVLGLELAQATSQRHLECIILLALVELNLRQQQWEKAAELLHQAEPLNLELEDKINVPIILRSWAKIKVAEGRPQEALQDAHQSVDLARANGDPMELGISLRILGEINRANQSAQDAIEAFSESFALTADAYPYEAAHTEMEWGLTLLAGGEFESGQLHLDKARAVFQTLGAQQDLINLEQRARLLISE